MKIPLKLADGQIAWIDEEDLALVSGYAWHSHKPHQATYARAKTPLNKTVYLHRLLLPGVARVDHRDGNGLNNTRENLRASTNSQNMGNRGAPKNNTSGFKGVSWSKRDQKFEAYINHGGKRRGLGYYSSAIKAAEAYDQAAVEAFGEFARLNLKETKK